MTVGGCDQTKTFLNFYFLFTCSCQFIFKMTKANVVGLFDDPHCGDNVFIYLFLIFKIYLFIFDCVGSSFLCEGFL